MLRDYDVGTYRGHDLAKENAAARPIYSFMNRVYLLMGAGLALTAIIAYFIAGSENLMKIFIANRGLFMVLLLAELGLVFILSLGIKKMSAATATAGFIAYSVLNGVTMACIFLAYTQSSIAIAFFSAAGAFGIMSLIGYFIRRDLNWIGVFGLYALVGLIVAMLVNIFAGSTALETGISIVGIILFAGLTAYDTQSLKKLGATAMTREETGKYAVIGALSLYLDFINMFLFMLRLFGGRR
ncbi:MAG: Bax inhibitor-1/YccA family protein [Victivallales bacterium]|nr:Bax inhibitor-1/YccA family protein [Victivallales bacterium]